MWQSAASRPRSMTRPALALLALLPLLCARAAYVTTPTFAERLDRLYEKLEELNISPRETIQKPHKNLYEKLEKLNALTPDLSEKGELTDEDEELLTAMQMWGMLNPDQLEGVVKDLQSVKEEEFGKSEKVMDSEDSDGDWTDVDPEGDYPADFYPDEEPETASTSRPNVITPSTLTRIGSNFRETIISAVDPIAATNERPTILDDSSLPAVERLALRRAAFANIAAVVKQGKCSEPQPRWFTVRHLAPAANMIYMPPCVQLHRCAPDSGCCYDEAEVCAPVAGDYVAIPFYLQKADGNRNMARVQFFNHTQCACVSRETLQTTVRSRPEVQNSSKKEIRESSEESRQRQNDWRASTEEPKADGDPRGEDQTAPPQLRRCTCPTLFLARPLNDGICSCVCDWPDPSRRRGCLSLARGREHFGLRDRVCVVEGDCNPPTCEYGAYEKTSGKCPQRRFRRLRYYHHRRLAESD